MKEEEAKQAFGQIAVRHQLEAELRRNSWEAGETTEQSIIRMLLQYVNEGFMDWEQATMFIKTIFEPEEND